MGSHSATKHRPSTIVAAQPVDPSWRGPLFQSTPESSERGGYRYPASFIGKVMICLALLALTLLVIEASFEPDYAAIYSTVEHAVSTAWDLLTKRITLFNG